MYSFKGSRIMIAGGSSGVGLETARLIASQGGEVIIASRDKSRLDIALKQIEGNASAVQIDASNAHDCTKVFQSIGKIDHLVISLSGSGGSGPFTSLNADAFRNAFDAKFWAYFNLAQKSIPYLSADGSITFVSAISARAANPGTAGLSAINAAIEGLIKPLAVELKPLRVNAVSPGVIDTPWWNGYDTAVKKTVFGQFIEHTPSGRIGNADDVAEAIAFLIGNTFMTGTVIECDGGLHLVSSKL